MKKSNYAKNDKAFRIYNQRRMDRAMEVDVDRSRIAFSVIPLLLHCNHATLPGYVSPDQVPGGIYLYDLFDDEDEVGRALPSIDLDKIDIEQPTTRKTILSLALMGSIGTLAQTRESDFDYWVVVDEDEMLPGEMEALRKKLTAIETWADSQRMEVHFFICDVEKTRNNEFGAADKESAGSSQKRILKEEFYRTLIHVAGKTPLWWLFKPGLTDEEYLECLDDFEKNGDLDQDDYVDLGNASLVPMGELFGALLWQFNKAMSSPYKSVLKMGLIESLITFGRGRELLCGRLKKMVQESGGKTDVDPYLLMFQYIQEAYSKTVGEAEAELLRKCFFIKTFDGPISDTRDSIDLAFKERAIRTLLRRWNWSQADLTMMNNFMNWDFNKTTSLAAELHRAMIGIYTRLSDRVAKEKKVETHITSTDLSVLGRKLYTLYSAKDKSKIEFLKRIRNESQNLEAFSFAVDIRPGRPEIWRIYRDNVVSMIKKGLSVSHLQLRQGGDPVALIMWLMQNRISKKNSFYYLVQNQNPVSLADLQQLIDKISSMFPPIELMDLDPKDLVEASRVGRILVGVNILTPRWKEKVERIHVMYSNSWGEQFCSVFDIKPGLKYLSELYRNTVPGFSLSSPAHFDLFIPKSHVRGGLKKEMQSLIGGRLRR